MKSLGKCIVMLLRKNGCRHKVGHLFSIIYCFKCCTNRYFCLSITNISTDQTVHDLSALHLSLIHI